LIDAAGNNLSEFSFLPGADVLSYLGVSNPFKLSTFIGGYGAPFDKSGYTSEELFLNDLGPAFLFTAEVLVLKKVIGRQQFNSGLQPKLGSSGGPGEGKPFSTVTQDAARAEASSKCVFCGVQTIRSKTPHPQRSNIDHAIPKSRGGNNTLDNAQNTCQTCNFDKRTQTTEEYLKRLNNIGIAVDK